jgi:8-oxo-dGTP diphosphatase
MNKRAGAIIIRENKVLLMHRFARREEYWVFPGGGVAENETIEQAMVREVQEELSLKVVAYHLLFEVFNPFTMGKFPPRQEYYYLVTDFEGEATLGGEEAQRMNEKDQYYPTWVDVATLREMNNLVPDVAKQKVVELLNL